MDGQAVHELSNLVLATGIVATVSVILLLPLVYLLGRHRLFWPAEQRSVRAWTGAETLAAFIVVLMVLPEAVRLLVKETRLLGWACQLLGLQPHPDSLKGDFLLVWTGVIVFPFQLLFLWFLSAMGPSRVTVPYRSTARNPVDDLWRGWIAWLFLGVCVDLLNLIVTLSYSRLTGLPEETHELVKVARQVPYPLEWSLILLAATICAPIIEELLFRGILLRWLLHAPGRSLIVLGLALCLALLLRSDHLMDAMGKKDWMQFAHQLEPACFVLLVLPVLIGTLKMAGDAGRVSPAPAILGSSILFAILHATSWPNPVPLFFLALGLGWLTWRTGSVVPSIVVHVLFNAVACVQIVLGTPGP